MKRFLSGDEALAEGVRLARPQVISAYPITPQTVVVERLSEMVADGTLQAEYMHVESEHSALSCAMGASATGARTFTATSSQGLLYMAEVLSYAAGGRFPIVMMNANRSTALPWNIYGDQRDSLALLDHGWIQAYALDNQEALDLTLMAYAIAENPRVSTPFMVNLDGFALTHTYETVDVPTQEQADEFLPPYETSNKFDFEHPVNMAYSAGPAYNRYYKYYAYEDMLAAEEVIDQVEARFAEVFGRTYPGMVESYRCEDAEFVVVTLGSIAGLVRNVVDDLRGWGKKVGLARIRYMRPFPYAQLAQILGASSVKAAAVLEKDISFGAEGTVFTNVNSALQRAGIAVPTRDFVGGLGGDDISYTQVEGIFTDLEQVAAGGEVPFVQFLGVEDAAPAARSSQASSDQEVRHDR
jgi:pyruvate ferredoxin oxidoreductase alpha subunit